VKFQIERGDTDKPQMYFINTKTHRGHPMFMRRIGISRGRGRSFGGSGGSMRGVLIYRPLQKAPNGDQGLYTFEYEPNDSYPYDKIKMSYDLLIEKMPILKGRLGYYPMPRAVSRYQEEKELYEKGQLPVYLDEVLNANITFLPLNYAQSFGRLRVMENEQRPSPREIVLCQSLPNEMPRVAGIISDVRQTPLSHVNLRAVQDRVPNAYINNASQNKKIASLVGKNVYYKVASDGYELREATQAEVDAHFASLRPAKAQTPKRNLTVTEFKSLADIKFSDSAAFGVKTANLAVLRSAGFPPGTVPAGFGLPFSFYDEFMKHNGLFNTAKKLLSDPEFQENRDQQIAGLKKLRKQIKSGEFPASLMAELSKLQKSFPAGQAIRCRSSTNNEDLPGFSGAGLYDSFTHNSDEGHLAKTIKQVYASLWNFRAFEERQFYRIDHFQTAMGVLVHPNFSEEKANGVAVTDDIVYQTYGNYYINAQVGEDLVTTPAADSVPEELLLDWWRNSKVAVMRNSNRLPQDERILQRQHLDQLRKHLSTIHADFAQLYGKDKNDQKFAMEIEFKITKNGKLIIKQARPWVYAESNSMSK
jgi:hypothetical protein